jgi:hypothetical protein
VHDEKDKRKQMNTVSLHRQLNSIAKQAGFMPTSWLAINSLSCDRTPEGIYPQGSREGWDD